MRFLFITMLLICSQANAQEGFFYGGYRIGSYIIPESVPAIYATRFNEGYTFSRSDDDGMISFTPTASPAQVVDEIQWGYLQNGICIGGYANEDGQPLEFGFHQFNQQASGKRYDPIKGEERLTLQSRSGGLYFNVFIYSSKWFKPYVGFEAGTFRLRYWYSSEQGDDVNRQSLGYRQDVFRNSGSNDTTQQISGVGDRPIYLGLNVGFHLQVIRYQNFSIDIVTQYQGRWNHIEDISMAGKGPDLISRHGNASVSVLIAYEFFATE